MTSKENLKTLIKAIKAATGKTQREISVEAGYKPNSLAELLSQKSSNCEPVYKQLSLVFGAVLKKSTTEASSVPDTHRFTADQLFHMYMKAMERQDKLMEAQTVILNNIENKMARQDVQGQMKVSLDRVDQLVTTIAERQEDGIIEFRKRFSKLGAGEGGPLKGARRKEDRNVRGV